MSNESVEDLLKSLRATVQKRQNNEERDDDVLELKNPIKPIGMSTVDDSSVSGLISGAIEKAVVKYLSESNFIGDIVEKYLLSERFEEIVSQQCNNHFEGNRKFENLIKEIIEQKIAKIMR